MSAEARLDGFIAKFTPENQGFIRACRLRMRARFPGAHELVYDNYNFLVIAYAPSETPSDAVISLAADKHGVTLCFLVPDASLLADPAGILRGTGARGRNVRLTTAADLDRPDVVAVMDSASRSAPIPMPSSGDGGTVIRSESVKQRPRR